MMSDPRSDAALRELLNALGVRATAPRVAVLRVLRASDQPMTHAEVTDRVGEVAFDRVTLYRNLTKLVALGLARVVSREGGVARYEAVDGSGAAEHTHAHFVCTDCGTVECLPEQVVPKMTAGTRWERSLARATVQLQGACPDCLDASDLGAAIPS